MTFDLEEILEAIMVEWVTAERLHQLTGYSVAALNTKAVDGTWAEGQEWKWALDGRRLFSIKGYNAWAARPGRASTRGRRRSFSSSGATDAPTSQR